MTFDDVKNFTSAFLRKPLKEQALAGFPYNEGSSAESVGKIG